MKIKIKDPNIKVLTLPLTVIVISLFSLYLIILKGFPDSMALYEKVKEARKIENTYNARLDVLKEFNKSAEQAKSDITFTVLPDKNPAAVTLSQVKSLILNGTNALLSVEIEKIENLPQNLYKADMTFQLVGDDFVSAIELIRSLSNSAPLTSVSEAVIERDSGNISSKITSSLYWSKLPEKLPSLTEPLVELTSAEKETLKKVTLFRLPELSSSGTQVLIQERENPFE